MKKAIAASILFGATALAGAQQADAAVTQSWPVVGTATPPYNQAFTVNNPPFAVTFDGIVTTTYAEDLVTSSTGQYSDNVLVLCSTGAINQNTNANGSVIVACPFFIGTVLQGAGSVTSYP